MGDNRKTRLTVAVASIMVIHVGLLAYSATCHTPVIDEIGHLPAGWSHWQLKRFDLFNVNPPLVRTIAALPVFLSGTEIELAGYPQRPGGRPEFGIGERWIKTHPNSFLWSFTLARWACIPFSVLGGFICFCWARDLYGSSAGLMSLCLWCFSPTVLGHASLLTPDVPAASFGAAAAYVFMRWIRKPSFPLCIACGITLGLSQLCKMTLVLLYVLWPCLWLMSLAAKSTAWNLMKRDSGYLAAMFLISLWILNNGYLFEDTGKPLGSFRFFSKALSGETWQSGNNQGGNRFSSTLLGYLPVPLPRNYLQGMDQVKFEYEHGYWSYLRGEMKHGGWWYYYLYAMLVKMPLGTLALLGISVASLGRSAWLAVRRRQFSSMLCDELFLLIPAVGLIAFVSSQTGFNHHLRYVLPAFPFLFILASGAMRLAEGVAVRTDEERIPASGVTRVATTGLTSTAILGVVCVMTTTVSSLSVYPHSLSYFNELSGGSVNGWKHLDYSNVDWGQDLLYAKEWVDAHPHASPVYVEASGLVSPADLGMVSEDPEKAKLTTNHATGTTSSSFPPGWYIIGLTRLVDPKLPVHEFLTQEPADYIGYSMRVYQVKEATPGR